MLHRWDRVTFVHWRYRPADVQALLPPGLSVEAFDGGAWVSLVPFRMRVRFPGIGALPWVSTFPETNVRTYVVGPDGWTGIWFFSLDAGRLAPVLTARATLQLPYMWAGMSIARDGGRVRYRSARWWPGPRGARADADVEIGPALGEPEPGSLDDFLTMRFRLYTRFAGGAIGRLDAEHRPWPLRRAVLVGLREEVVEAAGLPAPAGPPLVHYSDGVGVRIGPPSIARI
jgi:uncharacterized protein